jgi:hypothetical protein
MIDYSYISVRPCYIPCCKNQGGLFYPRSYPFSFIEELASESEDRTPSPSFLGVLGIRKPLIGCIELHARKILLFLPVVVNVEVFNILIF